MTKANPRAPADFGLLTEVERWQWHAYDYAFRHVALGEPLGQPAPMDERREWFDERAVRAAVALYRRMSTRPRPFRISPADEAEARGDRAKAALFREQDRERAALKAAIVGDGRLPNGEMAPELAAFIACCVRQTKANCAAFATKAMPRRRDANSDSEAIRRVYDALGVAVMEQAQ